MAIAALAVFVCAPLLAQELPDAAAVNGMINDVRSADSAVRDRGWVAIRAFYAEVADWPESRFASEPARGFVALMEFLASIKWVDGDSPQLQRALGLARRERLDGEHTGLAAVRYSYLQKQDRLSEVAGAGLEELDWLCTNAKPHYAIAEAALASVVMDACCRVNDWGGAERVAKLLPGVEGRIGSVRPEWRPAVCMMIAQARFAHTLALGQPERAARFLAAEEEQAKSLGEVATGPALRAGLLRDRVALWLANEDFAGGRRAAEESLKQLASLGLSDDERRAFGQRFERARIGAMIRQGKLAEAGPSLASVPGALPNQIEEAWIAHAKGEEDRFLQLAEIADADVAACEEETVRMMARGLQLRAALARKSTMPAEQAARLERLREIRGQLQAALDRLLDSVAALPTGLGGVGFFHFEPAQQLLMDLADAELALLPTDAGVRRALATILRAQSHGSLARALAARRRVAPADLAAIQASLAADAVALVFLPGRYGSALFGVQRDSVWFEPLPPRTEFEELVRQVAAQLLQVGEDPSPELMQGLDRLRGLLLPDVVLQRIVSKSHWIISAGSTLAVLPFEALPLADGLVGERHSVSNLLSLSLLPLLRMDTPKAPSLLLVATLSPAGAGRADLRLDKIVVAPVGDRTPALLKPFGQHAELVDALATEGALRNQDLCSHDILHILAHGAYDHRRDFPWGIALGGKAQGPEDEDGQLWAEDVALMHSRGLVILSACRVGRAPRRLGEDHAGNLGGAFLYGGSSAVVQSRIPIVLGETCSLMEEYHGYLAKGEPWAESLRAARAALPRKNLGARLHAAQMQLTGWSR